VSDDIKDLISRMLVVDPLQRITIPEIRRHRWFTESLPLYLSVTPDQIMSQFRAIDEEVLSEVVMKIGFDRGELLDALHKQERNQMTVAYYLILDHKRRKMLGDSPVMHATQMAGGAAGAAAEAAAAAGGTVGEATPAVPAGVAMQQPSPPPPAAPQQPLVVGANPTLPSTIMSAAARPSPTHGEAPHRRWHLGVQSSLAPADMMLEIFRALRHLRFEWKIVAQYSLKCRPCSRPADGSQPPGTLDASSPHAVRCKVKIGLQLYKIQEDSYLLDIRKVDGDVMPFMDVCSLLLSELKL
jgi:5'-AMP-activated protein kinase catalytic alpha subunit